LKNILIVGSGIVGITTAIKFQKSGYSVTIVDKSEPGNACSFGNAGVLGTSTCTPLSMPGIISDIPKLLFDDESALTIKASYLARNLTWFSRFLAESKKRNVSKSAQAMRLLNGPSVILYKALAKEAQCESLIKNNGYLHLYENSDVYHASKFAWTLRSQNGVTFEDLSAPEIRDLLPSVSEKIRHGIYVESDGHCINPKRLVDKLFEYFTSLGGKYLCTEAHLNKTSKSKLEVVSSHGVLNYDKLVICTGSSTKKLLENIGYSIPILPERGYHLSLKNPNVKPAMTIMSGDYKYVTTLMEDGLRLAGIAEFGAEKSAESYEKVTNKYLRLVKRMFPAIECDDASLWSGCRPSTPDSNPIIDKLSNFENVFVNAGHGHTGLAGAPRSAEILFDLVEGNPCEATDMFNENRF